MPGDSFAKIFWRPDHGTSEKVDKSARRTKKPLWQPKNISSTNIDNFRRFINARRGLALKDTRELHAWSVDGQSAGDFWLDLFHYLEIKSDRPPSRAMDPNSDDSMFPPPSFYPGIKLNFAENLLAERDPTETALFACQEGGTNLRGITWGEIVTEVRRLADAMRSAGVATGDRIGAVITNCPETLTLCLAALSIGALWSTISPDMGVSGILDRLSQIRPKLVFAESSVLYNRKKIDLMGRVAEWTAALNPITEFQRTIIIPRYGDVVQTRGMTQVMLWDNFITLGTGRALEFTPLTFNHPCFIVYSSGTTGSPKCIVHSGMGMLLQVKKDSMLHGGLCKGDISFQYTTTGWIMWGMVICALGAGAKVVVYDGSPSVPDATTLLSLVSELKVTMFGTSARYLTDLKASNTRPREHFDFSALKTVTSTGSVLTADVAQWFYQDGFPPDVHLVSMSGGTDMACTLVHGDTTRPLWPGEIQAFSLGMAVDVFDADIDEPRSIQDSGNPGELVCTRPFPSQPVTFWGEGGMERYKDSYFKRFGTKIWCQGDFISVTTDTRGILMLGRSDGTLNPSGVRFGSAEIYEIVDRMGIFEDTICVGQRRSGDRDESVILFVKMKHPHKFTSSLCAQVKAEIKKARSPRHVPRYILEVSKIPYTTNGKKVELAVKRIVSGIKNPPSSAVANPECFRLYEPFVDVEARAAEQEDEWVKRRDSKL